MNKNVLLFSMVMASATLPVCADELETDSAKLTGNLPGIDIFAMPKENMKLADLPLSYVALSNSNLQKYQIHSMKDLTAVVPNLYMPDYGSRLTSTIALRGIGARIGQPAVGLYVNDIPVLDKSAYDFDFYDVDHIQVLSGAQGTLYGRNTMGGLINVYTRNPFDYQGTDLRLSATAKGGDYKAALAHYHRISSRFAFSTSGFWNGRRGFFMNETLDERADKSMSGGGKINLFWKPVERLNINALVGYEYSDENGYAYGQYDKQTGEVGAILSNRAGQYRRGLLNSGLNVEYRAGGLILKSVTGYQHLDDRMFLDQDFTAADIFSLEQKQREHTFVQELYLKNKPGTRWQWTTGVSGFYQWLRTTPPVTFYGDGISFLNQTINAGLGNISNETRQGASAVKPSMSIVINDPELLIPGTFKMPTWNLSAFHQSAFRLTNALTFTAGLRLEYENLRMKYDSSAALHNYDFNVAYGAMSLPGKGISSTVRYQGELKNHDLQLLPKFALQYELRKRNTIYLAVSKGYHSGGYNIQMFSDLIQSGLQGQMIQDDANATYATLDELAKNNPHMPVDMIKNLIKANLPKSSTPDPSTTGYRPEYSWNYEAGGHFSMWENALHINTAVFFMDTRNTQITRFVGSGLGRQMVNAGHSQSYGAELSFESLWLNRRLRIAGSYGYTHAIFKDYDAGNNGGKGLDYTDNYVPLVPQHTFNISADYTIPVEGVLRKINVGAGVNGAGRIYWTEANDVYQDLYANLQAYVAFDFGALNLNLWGKNLTNAHYNTFYFENMNRGFAQVNKPLYFGVDLTMHF